MMRGRTATADTTDWAAVMQRVAPLVLGNPAARTASEWRWGRKGSLAVYTGEGRWHDFEADVGGGVLDLLIHRGEATDRQGAMEWLERCGEVTPTPPPRWSGGSRRSGSSRKSGRPGGARGGQAPRSNPPSPTSANRADRQKDAAAKIQQAQRIWNRGQPVPADADHPARRWLAARCLWRPGYPLPDALRWLEPTGGGDGLLVCLAAPIASWLLGPMEPLEPPRTWGLVPLAPPPPRAVQTIAIAADGSPGRDKGGRGKRSLGALAGSVVMLGGLGDAYAPVRVAEGVADALALAARYPGPVFALLGVSGYRNPLIQAGLAALCQRDGRWRLVIHADTDDAGQKTAAELRAAMVRADVDCRAVLPTAGAKDAGEVKAAFTDLPDRAVLRGYMETLRECQPTLPTWELYRQTSVALAGQGNPEREPAEGGQVPGDGVAAFTTDIGVLI